MSHIVACAITGLAGRTEEVSVTFDRHLNVFFGRNGSGKTSLLKILHSALSLNPRPLLNVPFRRAMVQIYTVAHDKTFTLSIDRDDLDRTNAPAISALEAARQRAGRAVSAPAHSTWAWRYDDAEPEIRDTKRWAHRYLPTTRLYLSPTAGANRPVRYELDPDSPTATYSEESLERLFAVSMAYLWQLNAAEIFSGVRQAQETGLANILRDVLMPTEVTATNPDVLDRDTARRRVENFLRRRGYKDFDAIMPHFDSQFGSDPRVRRVVRNINEVETRIEEAMSPLHTLSSLLSSLYSGGKSVRVNEKGVHVHLSDASPLELDRLSAGEKHVLRVLVEALFVGENALLIDEPELSLHVDWQRSLLKYLRTLNAHTQIIAATHSPEIMADVSDEHIFRL